MQAIEALVENVNGLVASQKADVLNETFDGFKGIKFSVFRRF